MLWQDIGSYAREIELASIGENRKEAVYNIFFLLAEAACDTNGPSNTGFGWDDDFGIITKDLAEAEVIANIFDAAYGEKTCITGEWNREEDEASATVDAYTGHGYVRIWQ